MTNSAFFYQYRDASNYKQSDEVIFAGEPTEALAKALLTACEGGEYFLAEQVGLESQRAKFDSHFDDDHIWHEIDPREPLRPTRATPTDDRSIAEFVAEFVAAGQEGWDEDAAEERLAEWVADTREGR